MPAISHCARPGCGGTVAAWLTYDYGERTVWLDAPEVPSDGSSLALCAPHADQLRVPLGWTCRDRRTAARPSGTGPIPARPAAARPTGAERAASRPGADSRDGPEPGSGRPAVAV